MTRHEKMQHRLFQARIAYKTAQAHLDAMDGDPAKRAWAEVMEAFYRWVSEEPEQSKGAVQ